jgi:hypothetical protein
VKHFTARRALAGAYWWASSAGEGAVGFQFACFVSYRHPEGELGKRFVEDLCKGLADEIEQYGRKVCIDSDRLQGGHLYNEALASSLCRSACMVLVFAPNYFDPLHPYCAREFHAMEKLEQQRLELLPPLKRDAGLIIPIVLRGLKRMPEVLRGRRQFWDFSKFTLAETELSKNPAYADTLRKIAEYVDERARDVEDATQDPCACCETFALPTEADVEELLRATARPAAFPLRGAGP